MKPVLLFGLRHWRTFSAVLLAGAAATFFILSPPAVAFIAGITILGHYTPFAFLTTASAAAIGASLTLIASGIFNLATNALSEIKNGFRKRSPGPVEGRSWSMFDVAANALFLSFVTTLALTLIISPFAIMFGPSLLIGPLIIGGAVGAPYFLFMTTVALAIGFDNLCRKCIKNIEKSIEEAEPIYVPDYNSIIPSYPVDEDDYEHKVEHAPAILRRHRSTLPEANPSKFACLYPFFSGCGIKPRRVLKPPFEMMRNNSFSDL